MRTNRLLAVTVLSVLGVTGLAACDSGGDGKKDAAPAASASAPASAASATSSPAAADGGLAALSAGEILERTRAAGGKLTSVRTTFTMKSTDGDVSGSVAADSSGNCSGTFTVDGKGKAEILGVGDKKWLKPDAGFLGLIVPEGNTAVADAMAGKWLTGEGAGISDSEGFGWFCEMGLEGQRKVGLLEDGSPDSSAAKAGTEQVGGAGTVVLKVKDEGSGDPMDAAIATTGEPHLLSVVGSGSDGSGDIRFGDFDKPVAVTAPPAAQVFDMDAMLTAAG
ncbi:hypothetical protein [Kitasatospora sp. NPDC057198]|uniref:hypothetical protein n=1 Tax=Kitasatospora sp. NPDC057198 TaxID=3346046 RepID=UPI00362C1E79